MELAVKEHSERAREPLNDRTSSESELYPELELFLLTGMSSKGNSSLWKVDESRQDEQWTCEGVVA